MEQIISKTNKSENKTIENDSVSVATQTDRVFSWLRQNTGTRKTPKKTNAFSKSRTAAIKSRSTKDFINQVFYAGKNNYFQRRYFFPIFLSGCGLCVSLLTIFFIEGKYPLIAFTAYAIIAVMASAFMAGLTTFIFQKHQENEIEHFSQLDEICREQNFAFELKKTFDSAILKRALIHLKKDLDSLNYLLPLSSIFLSCSVLLGAYGIFLDSVWESESKSLLSQQTISQVVAGFIFLSGAHVVIFGYARLRKLREWQAILELSN